jgi:hypothetical protein
VDLAPNLGGEGQVLPPEEGGAGAGRGRQEPLRLGRAAGPAPGGQRGDAARESPPPGHASLSPKIGGREGGREMSLEKKSETKRKRREGGGGGRSVRFVWGVGVENGGGTGTRGAEGGHVDAPVLPRLAVERTRNGQ